VAAAGTAEEDRPLVADQRAAAVGQDRRACSETCLVLLALAGRGASNAAPVRGDGAADRGAARARGVIWAMAAGTSVETEVRERSSVYGAEGKGSSSGFGQHGRGRLSPLGSERGHARGKMSLAWLEGRHVGVSSHEARRSKWKSRFTALGHRERVVLDGGRIEGRVHREKVLEHLGGQAVEEDRPVTAPDH
jgi:hypothetical protein